MGQPERSASSTRRTPSTPTNPLSVGSPPRRATRNSLSQRLSRLVISAGSLAERGLRAVLPGAAIPRQGNKFQVKEVNRLRLRRSEFEGNSILLLCFRCYLAQTSVRPSVYFERPKTQGYS